MQTLPIVNKVAQSGLLTLDMEKWLPAAEAIVTLDLKDFLFRGLLLKEKDFREQVAVFNWSQYQNKYVGLICSTDAIIPHWAYMLLADALLPFATGFFAGDEKEVERQLLLQHISQLDAATYTDQRVVVKGCGDRKVGVEAYLAIAAKLQPVVKSLMYGEPCSTVPIYKAPKSNTNT